HVEDPEVDAVEDDHPGAGSQDRNPGSGELPQRRGELLAFDALRDHCRLSPGQDQRVETLEVCRRAYLARLRTDPLEQLDVGLETALDRDHSHQRRDRRPRGAGCGFAHQPRGESSSSSWSFQVSRLAIAGPRPVEAAATRAGSAKWVVASTIARARRSGSADLKIPEPTNTPSAPSCMTIEASAGVAIPPAQNRTTGSRPSAAIWRTRCRGDWSSLAAVASSASSSVPRRPISPRIFRRWRTASTMSPVPASPLERIIAAPSPIRLSASPRLVAPQTKGTLKAHLSMWLASSAGVSTSDSST